MNTGVLERPGANAARIKQAFRLTERQRQQFWQDGFIPLYNLTTPADIDRISSLYDRMFEEKAGWKDGNYFDLVGGGDDPSDFKVPHLQRITDYCPALLETDFMRNAATVASQLLGGRVKRLYDSGITKPAFGDTATPWHQDAAFLVEESYFETVTFWLPLHPVTEAQGCMKFLPGTHRSPIIPHRSPGGDNRINGLEAVGVGTSDAIACPLPLGAATVHHFKVLHATGGNQTAIPRRVLTVGFGIRRARPTVAGNFPWLAAKDNERLQRWRHAGPMARLRGLARPVVNLVAVGLRLG
jgi:hypothetical protein